VMKMRPLTVLFLLVAITLTTAFISPKAVTAQACPVCRARIPYSEYCSETNISNPPKGGIGFTGTVVELRRTACEAELKVRVKRSTGSALPSKIGIDLLPCLVWFGSVGDTINAGVFATPKPNGAYIAAACRTN